MIECPICHVMNEDQAHFCSECGQRFNVQVQSPPVPSYPSVPAPTFPSFPAPESYSMANTTDQPGNAQTTFPTAVSFPQPEASPSGAYQVPSFGAPDNRPSFPAPTANTFLAPPDTLAPPASLSTEPPPAYPGAAPNYDQGGPPASSPPFPGIEQSYLAQSTSLNTNPDLLDRGTATDKNLSSRPKLHSPILDGDYEDRPAVAKPSAPTKQRGLRSPLLRSDEEDEEPPKPKGKSGLRSPLLARDDNPPSAPARGKSLHSPLLGGADDDVPAQSSKFGQKKNQPKSGGSLRSPLLGAVDDYEGDDDELPPTNSKSPFPHVRRQPSRDSENADAYNQSAQSQSQSQSSLQAQSGKQASRPLRSPLLGGGDDDDEAISARPSSRGASGKQRLHSPVLGGGGYAQDDYEDEEPYYEEINDPKILRSPLLASRMPADRTGPGAPQGKSGSDTNEPGFSPQPSRSSTSLPKQNIESEKPIFRDRGFPDPEPAPPDMWRERGFPQTPPLPTHSQTRLPANDAPPEVSSSDPFPQAVPRKSSRSTLLPHDDQDDYNDAGNRYQPQSTVKSGPSLILLVPSALAVCAKLWYIQTMIVPLQGSPPFAADQGMQLIVLLALTIFAASAKRK